MNISEILNHDSKFRYMLLSRMQSDCEYYLGNGNHHSKHLWATDEAKHIEYMLELWNSFPEQDKPEWLSYEQINSYATEMGVDFNKVVNQIEANKAAKALQEFTNMSLQSENRIDTGVVLNLCNYYDTDTVINLLSNNQKDMLCNSVEFALDCFENVDKDLYNFYEKVIESQKAVELNRDAEIYVGITGDEWGIFDKSTRKELSLPSGYRPSELLNVMAARCPEYATFINNNFDKLLNDINAAEQSISDEAISVKYDRLSAAVSQGGFGEDKADSAAYHELQHLETQLDKTSVRDKLEKIKTDDNKSQPNNNNEKTYKDIVADFIAEQG